MSQDPSLRRLVDAVLITGFDGTTAPDWLRRRLEDGLGGVCWFAQNLTDPEQARSLADSVHEAREGVVVMTDEEGGDVTRIEAGRGSSWPGSATLGMLDDVDATHDVARELGHQLRQAGVDIALAPVVDVNSNPANPVIGVRSFGPTPDLVARHGVAFVQGVQSSGVAACAKHYPGHGATVVDSHLGLPRVGDPRALLEERDLAPFAAVVRAGVKCVMTAHVVFPAFDDRPATMSPVLLGHLRDQLGFDGVIVSDALDMSAISKGVGRGEGAVRSLSAGVDLVCIGNPAFPERYDAEARLDEIASAIDTAVREGRVTTTRLEEAAARASALRGWVTDQPDRDQAPDLEVGRRVAARALRLTGDVAVGRAGAVVLDLGGEVNIAAGRRDQRISEALVRRDPDCRLVSVASNGDLAGALAAWPDRPLVVVLRHPEREEPRAAMRTVLGARPDAVVVCTGPFTDADLGNRVVWASGGGRAVAEAVADVIVGDLT